MATSRKQRPTSATARPPHLRIMSAFRRRSIEANIFPASLPAVEPWEQFRWHGASGESCDTYKEKSSQALTIDVFGALKLSSNRDQVLDRLAASLGLTPGGPWEVGLEWQDEDNLLREKQLTRVDAVARGAHSLLFFECKFCEPDGGRCLQTQRIAAGRHKGLAQCNGYYRPQVNPATGQEARCALSAKGIRYWELIPEIFDYDAERSYVPCPFAGSWFQWMRNMATCAAVARHHGLQPAFVVVYADGPGLPMAQRVRLPEWQSFVSHINPAALTVRTLSFQNVIDLAAQAAPADPVWLELRAWVQRKIDSVCGPRQSNP